MNAYGNVVGGESIANGGTVSGDLILEQKLDVLGDATLNDFTAINGVVSGTLQVNILVSDIKTEDTLIHIGVNNPADALNLGYIEEYDDGATKFAGIVRYSADEKQYVITNTTPIPTGITNISSLPRGNLVCGNIEGATILGSGIGSTSSISGRTVGVANVGLAVRYTIDHETATDNMRILDGALTPILSLTQTGDLTTIGDITTNNLDVVGNYVNITDGVNYNYNFQYGQKVSARYDNSAGGVIDISLKTRGTKTTPTAVLNNDVLYTQFYQGHNGTSSDAGVLVRARCTEDWSVGNAGASYIIQVNNTGTTTLLDKLIVGDNIQIANATLNTDLIYMTNGTSYINDFNDGYTYKTRADDLTGVSVEDFRSRGTLGAPIVLNNSDIISIYNANGYYGSGFSNAVRLTSACTENWSATNRGSRYIISTVNIGSTVVSDKIIVDTDVKIRNAALIVGNFGVDFKLPETRASTTNQVLKDVLGNGVVSWETELASSETLQEAYNASTAPQISTTDAKGALILKHAGDPGIDYVLEITNSADTVNFSVDKNGGVFSNGFVQTSSILQGNDIRAINSLEVGSGAGVSYQLPPNRTTASEGDMLVLNDTTGILEFQKPLYLHNFTQNDTTSNISGTTDEIDLTSATGIGSLVIQANELIAGATFHIKCGGTIKNATVNDELRLRFYLGTSVVIDTDVIDLPKITELEPWIFEADITFRTIGATATSIFNGQFTFNDAGAYLGKNVNGVGDTVDLTANQTWKGTSQWSNDSVTNNLYTQSLYFYRIS